MGSHPGTRPHARRDLIEGAAAVVAGDCKFRVIRSGGYQDNPDQVRSANRVSTPPDIRIEKMGFRVALDLQ